MRINTDQLARALQKGLAPAWLIAGDEPLLTGEAADAVRARARAEGYAGRELFVTDTRFDWSEIRHASQSLSLFAERRILEIRMPTPRPGKQGGAVLASLAADPGPDNLLLVVTTRPEKDTWSSAWFKAFEKHGMFVQARPIAIERLPAWIADRAAKLGLGFEPGAAELLAERVEGNLLAAQQEIEMLGLLHPGARIGADDVLAAVANSARYDIYKLAEAALEGEAPRSLRILDGLRAEGVEPPLILWAICRELRALASMRGGTWRKGYGTVADRQEALLRKALERTAGKAIEGWFEQAALVDRQAKGQSDGGKAWTTLTGLVASIAGAALPPTLQSG
jgi:DNA polymerase-3 subunit delta